MIINCTPHDVNIYLDENTTIVLPKCESPARCTTSNVYLGDFDGIPIYHVVYEDVINLPNPEVGTIYVVSAIVAQAVKNRADVFAPDSGTSALRNSNGQIIAVRNLLKH
jgi:hypothetical protein